jgi:hypothetical protein
MLDALRNIPYFWLGFGIVTVVLVVSFYFRNRKREGDK